MWLQYSSAKQREASSLFCGSLDTACLVSFLPFRENWANASGVHILFQGDSESSTPEDCWIWQDILQSFHKSSDIRRLRTCERTILNLRNSAEGSVFFSAFKYGKTQIYVFFQDEIWTKCECLIYVLTIFKHLFNWKTLPGLCHQINVSPKFSFC